MGVGVLIGHTINRVARAVNPQGKPWGYLVTVGRSDGEHKMFVSAEAVARVGGALMLTTQQIVRTSDLWKVKDMSNELDFLKSLLTRRNQVSGDLVIPFDIVAKMLHAKYGKPYHVYRDIPLNEARVVIAPRGSGIIGVDADEEDTGRVPYFLFKTREGKMLDLSKEHYVLGFADDCTEQGFLIFDFGSTLTYTDQAREDPADLEFMLSHILV